MKDFDIMTNRPKRSKAHKDGHIAFYYYSTESEQIVEVHFDGVQKQYTAYATSGDYYMLHIPNEHYRDCSKVTVNIFGVIYEISIVKRGCKSYTIAWLNPLGGIDHFTFYSNKEEQVSVSKEKILTNNGYKVISSVRDYIYTVSSENETNNIKKWLSEIVASPKAWIIDKGIIIPIDVISDKTTAYSDDLSQIDLEFRLNKPLIMQRI